MISMLHCSNDDDISEFCVCEYIVWYKHLFDFDNHSLPSLSSSNPIAQTPIIELQALASKLPVPTQNNK
jgi:hypothetical protein